MDDVKHVFLVHEKKLSADKDIRICYQIYGMHDIYQGDPIGYVLLTPLTISHLQNSRPMKHDL